MEKALYLCIEVARQVRSPEGYEYSVLEFAKAVTSQEFEGSLILGRFSYPVGASARNARLLITPRRLPLQLSGPSGGLVFSAAFFKMSEVMFRLSEASLK